MLRKSLLTLLAIVAAAVIGYRLGQTTTAKAATGRVFEIRTYTAEPGKLEALHARFRDHTLAIFKKHNMTSVAYFAPTDEPLSKNTLTYILSFPNTKTGSKSRPEFLKHRVWKKVSN